MKSKVSQRKRRELESHSWVLGSGSVRRRPRQSSACQRRTLLCAHSLPTLCLLCALYVPTVCGLFAYCVLSFYSRFGTKKQAYSLYSSQEPFIHYLLCSAPCCRKTRADVGIKYLPTNQFVFRLFSLLFFGGRFPRYLVTNLVTNSSPNLVTNSVNHRIR